MKTSELTGAALDWAVAKCEGVTEGKDSAWYYDRRDAYNYSTDWSQGGPIIEREKLDVVYQAGGRGDEWTCFANDTDDNLNSIEAYGPTPLIAAMRCYVASKLGYEVDVPEELK